MTENTVTLSKDALVLSLPEAVEPVVWRMNLKEAKAAGFSVKQDKKNWVFIKRDSSGAESAIALFEDKDQAMNILMRVSDLLQDGYESQKQKGTTTSKTPQGFFYSEAGKWTVAIGGVLGVIALFMILASITPQTADPFSGTDVSLSENIDPSSATGVPVSADAFLSGQ